MPHHFFAYMSRMKHIKRWALMRNTWQEDIAQHSLQVGMIAHALACLRNERYGGGADPARALELAVYHEAPEVITGDLPTPIKYYNPDIKTAYKQVERIAGERLLDMLPPALRASYAPLVLEDDPEVTPIVKAADKLSAYIKCVEEQKAGNTEFDSAARQSMAALTAMDMPELQWFIDECLEPFSLNIDQL